MIKKITASIEYAKKNMFFVYGWCVWLNSLAFVLNVILAFRKEYIGEKETTAILS